MRQGDLQRTPCSVREDATGNANVKIWEPTDITSAIIVEQKTYIVSGFCNRFFQSVLFSQLKEATVARVFVILCVNGFMLSLGGSATPLNLRSSKLSSPLQKMSLGPPLELRYPLENFCPLPST